jgi:hypothetical protein
MAQRSGCAALALAQVRIRDRQELDLLATALPNCMFLPCHAILESANKGRTQFISTPSIPGFLSSRHVFNEDQ